MPEEFDFPLVTQPSRDFLNERQIEDYREHQRQLFTWAVTVGKNPDRGEGYSQITLEKRAYRIDQFYRWVWAEEAGYTLGITHDHADQ